MTNENGLTAGSLPTGTLTFLFTDLEGSTRLWEAYPVEMRQAMIRHDELIESVVDASRGTVVRPRGEGDSRFAVFPLASNAVAAAADIQRAFANANWPVPEPMRVRIAMHTGEAEARDGDYYGSAVNRCARVRALAYGGQTLLTRATYNLVSESMTPGTGLRDLGEHPLRDFRVPERIYELVIFGLANKFPPLKATRATLRNVPPAISSFIGREQEIGRVQELLAGHRLLTILGPGGSGKTRLALRAAEDLVEQHDDGGWFIDLTGLSNPSITDAYVINAVGAREEVYATPLQTLQSFFHEKSALLVIDNCEHVLAGVFPLVHTLLGSTERLKVLATSRQPLGIPGEALWTIPPLSTPASDQPYDVAGLLRYEAVRLFVERAIAVRPDYELSANNAHAVQQIAARLDGLPLAVELAAARTKLLPTADIAARLDDRFRLLVSHQNVVPRQKTLRNLIDWSYEMLSQDEKELLAILSVFVGGWTLEAAEFVADGARFGRFEVLDLLSHLVDKSLVTAERVATGERFRFLETIRQYARDRLEERDNVKLFYRNHATYFMNLAKSSYGESWGRNQRYWLERLEVEHDNLRAAMEWMKEYDQDGDMLLRTTGSLWHFWRIHGHISEGRAQLAYALEHSPYAGRFLRANGLRGASMLALRQGDYRRALEAAQESLMLFRDLGDKLGISRQLDVLGEIARYQADYDRAIQLHLESLAIGREIGDIEGTAVSLSQLGIIARDRGDYQQAREKLQESLALFQQLEDKILIARTLNNLGLVEHPVCDYERATHFFQEAVSLYRDLNDKVGISDGLQNLGNVARDQGELKQAKSFYDECLILKQELGDKRGIALAIVNMSEVAFYRGDYPTADDLAQKSLDIFLELGVRRGANQAKTLKGYAAVYQGNYQVADALAQEVLLLSNELNAPRAVGYSQQLRGLLAFAQGDVDGARQQFQAAYETFSKVEDHKNVAGALVNLARTAYRQGDLPCAIQYLDDSLAIARRLKILWVTSYALEITGLLRRREGDYQRSLELFCESMALAMEQDNLQGIANCLGALAGVAMVVGEHERAVRFFAAADRTRKSVGAQMGLDDRQEYEAYLDKLRLSVDPATFTALWSEGEAMSLSLICQDARNWHATGILAVPAAG